MAASADFVTVIWVDEKFQDGSWILKSGELPGFFLAGSDRKKLHADIPVAIKLLYRLNYGMSIDVKPVGETPHTPPSPKSRSGGNRWAAVPRAA